MGNGERIDIVGHRRSNKQAGCRVRSLLVLERRVAERGVGMMKKKMNSRLVVKGQRAGASTTITLAGTNTTISRAGRTKTISLLHVQGPGLVSSDTFFVVTIVLILFLLLMMMCFWLLLSLLMMLLPLS